jgi:hypothetical protein
VDKWDQGHFGWKGGFIMSLTLPCHARVNTEFDRRGMIVTCDAGKQVCPKQERQYLLEISCFSNGNPSVDISNCQPSEGEPVAKAGDASPEPDGSVAKAKGGNPHV